MNYQKELPRKQIFLTGVRNYTVTSMLSLEKYLEKKEFAI